MDAMVFIKNNKLITGKKILRRALLLGGLSLFCPGIRAQNNPVPDTFAYRIQDTGNGKLHVDTQYLRHPRIALVLSGGGSRGLAQIGTIKALEEAGIKPDIIIATSIGAIIGSLYASGLSAQEMHAITKNIDWEEIMANSAHRRAMFVSQKSEPIDYLFEMRFEQDLSPVIPSSISQGQAIYDIISPVVAAPLFKAKMDFDSLAIPLRVIATDIVTGRMVVFSKGNLSQIVRASCGVPLAYPPVALDSMLLLDGGLTANIPVDVAVQEGADYVIAADVTSPMWKKKDLKNPVRLYDQIVAASVYEQKKNQKQHAHMLIQPAIDGILNTDFSQAETLITRGYAATKEKISQIQSAIDSLHHLKPPQLPRFSRVLNAPYTFSILKAQHLIKADTLLALLRETLIASVTAESAQQYIQGIFSRYKLPFVNISCNPGPDSGTRIVINPGIVSDIRIEGNTHTRSTLIARTAGIGKGEIVTNELIKKAMDALYGTDLFYNVSIFVDGSNVVHILIKEKEYWCARLGLRFDEYYLAEGYLEPAYENLFGAGISAIFHLQYGRMREKYAFELHTNTLFSRNWANNLSFQSYISRESITKREEIPDTVTNINTIDYTEFALKKIGILLKLGVQLGRFSMIDGCIRLERFEESQTASSPLQDFLGYTDSSGAHLQLRFLVDNLDRYPFPQRGQRHHITIGAAGAGKTKSFININTFMSWYFTICKKHTFSPLIMFTWANKRLPSPEKMYVGGTLPEEKYQDIGLYNNVPFIGLRPRSIDGDIFTLLHCSYRFSVAKKLYLSIIADWGYAWAQNSGAREAGFGFNENTVQTFIKDAPIGLGISLAYQTIVGPLKVSWGRVVRGKTYLETFNVKDENRFYFSAGHDF
jgi:predicted acylesterase/phospholipase RssA